MKENKELKAEIKKIQSNTNYSSEDDIDNTEDEETLFKYKSKGYKQTNPQNHALLKCTVCKRTFIKERVLRKHMESHNEDGDWTCGDFECNFQKRLTCTMNIKLPGHRPRLKLVGTIIPTASNATHMAKSLSTSWT